MNNKFLVGGLLGTITSFFMGWLLYGTLLVGMISESSLPGVQKPMADIHWPFMIISNLAAGFFISYVYSKWAHITTFGDGLTAGATIGFFVGLIYDAALYATTNMMTLKGHMVDLVATIISTAVIGGVVGWWQGRK